MKLFNWLKELWAIDEKTINIIAWLIIWAFIITSIIAIWNNIGKPIGPDDWIYWP